MQNISENSPLISVLIPAYNAEKHLRECIESVVNQTYANLEIICVDDASTDSTLAILKEYAQKDSRIKLLCQKQNQGISVARRWLIENASGKYVMFLDSDDYYAPNACQRALEEMEKRNVDILHFSTDVVDSKGYSQSQIDYVKNKFCSYKKKLQGNKIFESCFIKNKFGWNLWNKIFKTELIKKSLPYIPQGRCMMGEDMLIFAIAVFFSQKYDGIEDKLYSYRYGDGVSTSPFMSQKIFISRASEQMALEGWKKFLTDEKSFSGNYREFYSVRTNEVANSLVHELLHNVTPEEGKVCFDALIDIYDFNYLLKKFVLVDPLGEKISHKIIGAESLAVKGKPIKHVAFFYYRAGNGGVERVISKLAQVMLDLGYKVTLIFEQELKDAYTIPSRCKVEIILPSTRNDANDYVKHATDLRNVIYKNKIDVLLYQATNSQYLIYDIIAVKTLGTYFIGTTHDWITSLLLLPNSLFSIKPYSLQLCDAVQTITQVERDVYAQSGVNTVYIPNPLTFGKVKKDLPMHECHNTVLWIGRIEHQQKNPYDALHIICELKKYIPDVKLLVVGKAETKKTDEAYDKYVVELGLSENVERIGYTTDVASYYQRADVLLMTSSYEVYPMVVGEAMSFGLPVVSFSMPYVEMFKNNANIQVEPHNGLQAAAKLYAILRNDELRAQMSQEALNVAYENSQVDVGKMWQELFAKVEQGQRFENQVNPNLKIYFATEYEHYLKSRHGKGNGGYEKTLILFNLFRYFKKFGVKQTFKKIFSYIKRHGLFAALRKGKDKLN